MEESGPPQGTWAEAGAFPPGQPRLLHRRQGADNRLSVRQSQPDDAEDAAE